MFHPTPLVDDACDDAECSELYYYLMHVLERHQASGSEYVIMPSVFSLATLYDVSPSHAEFVLRQLMHEGYTPISLGFHNHISLWVKKVPAAPSRHSAATPTPPVLAHSGR